MRSGASTSRNPALGAIAIWGLALLAGLDPGVAAAAEDLTSTLAQGQLESARELDERGLSTLRDTRARSPSGFLYPYPLRPQPFHGESLQLRGFAELGYVASFGEEDEARFQKYSDRSDGFLLRNFSLEGRQREDGRYFEIGGGSVGRDDQFYHAEIGYFGLFRIGGFYDSLSNVYADDARILFSGAGGEYLSMPASLTLGRSTAAEIQAALSGVGKSKLSQKRNESGIELELRLLPELTLSADYRLQRRDGERPFGGTLGLTFDSETAGSVIETLEPIHSKTHDWSAGLAYATDRVQANLRYRGSHYNNERDSLTWENPFYRVLNAALPFLNVPGEPRGRSALSPDNQLHQISSDLGFALPLDGRLTTSVVWTRMRQNERLLPATINPGVTDFDELSRGRGDARVDHLLVRTHLRARPIRPLSVGIDFRFFMRDDDTDYFSRNPASDEYGYVLEDLSATNRVGAPSFSYRRWSLAGDVNWRIAKYARLGLELEHESTHRNNRARREVRDNRARLSLSSRAIPRINLRLAYEFLHRSGSKYETSRDHDFYTDAPGSPRLSGPERSLLEFRQIDLASRDRHALDLRINWLATDRADLNLVGRYQTSDFRPSFGVTSDRVGELGLEANYQLSPRFNMRAFTSLEWRDRRMATINSNPGRVFDLSAGGTTFPLSNRWSWDSDSRTISVGMGITARLGSRVILEADYSYLRSHEIIDTDFDRSGGALTPSSDPATAPTRLPSLRSTDHVLDFSGTYQWSEKIGTKLFYQFYHSTIEDFHQQGLVPLVNQNLFLGHVDDDFTAHSLGATASFRY